MGFLDSTIFLQEREQITGTEMPEAAMRLEERSDTKLERSGRIKDQRRIMEAQSDVSIRLIEKTDMNGGLLDSKTQWGERNAMH
jgi:hypothetical protein